MAKMTPEGRVKSAIKKKLQEVAPDSFHFLPVSNGMGRHGIPDFVCCVPTVITPDMVGGAIGVFVGIEAKTHTGKISPLQHTCLDDIKDASGSALVVWGSEDVNKIDDYMDSIFNNEVMKDKP